MNNLASNLIDFLSEVQKKAVKKSSLCDFALRLIFHLSKDI